MIRCRLLLSFSLIALTPLVCAKLTAPNQHHSAYRLHVSLSGLGTKTNKNVQLALGITAKNNSIGQYQSKLAAGFAEKRARLTILKALKPYGYFNVKIQAQIQKQGHDWRVQYHIKLGQQVHFAKVDWSVNGQLPAAAIKKIHERWPLHSGQVFSSEQYRSAKALLLKVAQNSGYLDAHLSKHHCQINLQRQQADCQLQLNTGQRYRFGETHFNTNVYEHAYLKRFLTYRAQQAYDQNLVERTRQGFISADNFSSVSVIPVPNNKTHRIPMRIILTPAVARSYTLGAGYGTDTGVRGSVGATFRQLNRHGDQLKAYVRASAINSAVMLSYNMPGLYPPTDFNAVRLQLSHLQQISGTAKTKLLQFLHQNTWHHWTSQLSLNALEEHYNLSGSTINFPKTETHLLMARWRIERSALNRGKYQRTSYHVMLETSGAIKSLLSKTGFWQIHFRAAILHKIWQHNRILGRVELGYTDIKRLNNLPLTLQLFAGGSESIRGFRYMSIGPGRLKAIANLEWQHEVIPNWYLAAFCDVGNVGDSSILHKKPYIGIGPALVWDSPLGHLEISVGFGRHDATHATMIQFNLGSML